MDNNPIKESQSVLSSKGGATSPQKNISGDLFSSRLIQESPLSEEVFNTSKSASGQQSNQQNSQANSRWSHNHSLRTAFYVGTAIVACLLLLSGLALYLSKNKTSKPVAQYGNTSADLTSLSTVRADSAPGLVVVNGNTVINGAITANSFTGNGADLTNLNATNITQGILNDARLSANVALLDANQTFTATNLFTGQVGLPVATSIAGQNYNWPQSQGAGVLTNDGTGTLVWNTTAGCLTCISQGGNAFGAPTVIGTNDPFNLVLRAGGVDRLSISPAGSASLNGSLSANGFTGDGSALTNLNASQIMSGTLSNARLSTSVTTQGNVFNGIDQLVQLNNLGYLPTLNGGNLTSLNASNITSGTLLDARLSANVPRLDGNQTFSGNNTFSQPLTVNTITPTAAMTIGSNTQNLTLQGNSLTSLNSTNAGGNVKVNFNGVSAGNVTYQFDASVAAGTYTICTTAGGGGCGGGGGGGTVSSPGGTSNKLAKFTGAQSIADSSITDTGVLVSIAAPNVSINGAPGAFALDVTGDINAGTYLRVGGNVVCDSTGCIAGGGGGSFINNSTVLQTTANFNFQSSAANAVGGKIRGAVAQVADLLDFQNSAGTVLANVDASGNINTTSQFQINGVAFASSNLSDASNLAKLNANQTFTGNNTFEGTFIARNAADSTTGFTVKNSGGTNILVVDTTNQRVAVGTGAPAYPLDVTGDINSSTGLRVGGNLVCDNTGCASSGSSGFYIQNGVAQQNTANFNIQSANSANVVGVVRGATGQTADLFQAKDGTGSVVFKIGNAGALTSSGSITFAAGTQSITNNTGGLNLVSNGTTIAMSSTTTITSGDGTGLRYAADYAYQPLSLVSRQYVDNSISAAVIGSCPTCFLKGGNSFGTTASLGTNDNYTLTIKTANTTRALFGTDASVAFSGSTASNSYAFSTGAGTASGYVSFAGGELTTAASQDSFAMGYQSQVTAGLAAVAFGRQTTASNNYAMATGYLSVASGDTSFAANNSIASGLSSFAIGSGTASGQDSFAGGYNQSPITASGTGSFAFGRAEGFAITAAGPGSFALGYS
ncbi:hypothetical protein H0W80_04040, partial [Candidatus Saccharibacteria bacterium]|nr:hypothetical protein [Candidatus Saccharibacteria bacterium]